MKPGRHNKKLQAINYSSFLWIIAIGLGVSIVHSAHLHVLFENDRYFSHLSTLERELSFKTEMGLYYSYFKTLALAPSFSEGLDLIVNDNNTEYPSTINTLQRFNLYPEVVLGGLYRIWQAALTLGGSAGVQCFQISRGFGQPSVEACNGLGDPASFYVSCVFALNGFLAGSIFVLGAFLSENLAGGLVSCAFFFFNHGEATRVMWTPPLRESFAMPFLILQMLALAHCLRQKSPTIVHYGLVAAASLAFLLPWQFSQFVLVTQSFSLLTLHSLRLVPSSNVSAIFLSLAMALLGNILLQFCNSLLLFSLLPCSILSCLVVINSKKLFDSIPWKPLKMVLEVVSALVLAITFKAALTLMRGGGDDAHIGAILLSKFTAYEDFHTQLYTCSPEFDILPLDYPFQLTATLLLPAAAFAMARIGLGLFRSVVHTSQTVPVLPAEQVYFLVQCLAFAVLAFLIMRLKLFLTPHLCLVAAFLARSKFQGVMSSRWLVGLLLVGGSCKGIYNLWQQHNIIGEFNDPPLEELVEWVNGPALPSHVVLAGAMPTMAALRLSTSRPVVNHPHYEDAALRRRTHEVYSIYSRKPAAEIHDKLSRLLVTHVVVEEVWCKKRYRPGCSFAEVWDKEDPSNQRNQQFCELIHVAMPDQFQLVFSNSIYNVLKLL